MGDAFRLPAKPIVFPQALAIPACVRASWLVRPATVLLRWGYGEGMEGVRCGSRNSLVLRYLQDRCSCDLPRYCYGGYPVYSRCIAGVYPMWIAKSPVFAGLWPPWPPAAPVLRHSPRIPPESNTAGRSAGPIGPGVAGCGTSRLRRYGPPAVPGSARGCNSSRRCQTGFARPVAGEFEGPGAERRGVGAAGCHVNTTPSRRSGHS
jgi:hypothetical protein